MIAIELGNKEDIRKTISDIRETLDKVKGKFAEDDAEPVPENQKAALAGIKALLDKVEKENLKDNESRRV